jgi:hypothetical protein
MDPVERFLATIPIEMRAARDAASDFVEAYDLYKGAGMDNSIIEWQDVWDAFQHLRVVVSEPPPGDRPDYVKCVKRAAKGFEHQTWCGRDIGNTEFTFESADHAAENGLAGGRLVACPDCRKAIAAAMTE